MPAALYAIPTPLGGAPLGALPGPALEAVRGLCDFVAENPKSARAFLAAAGMPRPLRELRIATLDEHTPPAAIGPLLEPLRAGRSLGLLSEAGCPAIADPGAALVAAAHREGFRVVPLVGPSALVLAMMASGLEGQRFAFCGYLPRDKAAREARVLELERRSRRERETQIFIETPYRNDALLDSVLGVCAPATRLCAAIELTLPGEHIVSRTVGEWRAAPATIGKRPAVFLLLA
ncbi:MAG: SAM-dependent methyltransferase [Betaproteobacteria bacterium]|nr:SAM-dependent methyltransferase [Betaproteobacteria bacterium]